MRPRQTDRRGPRVAALLVLTALAALVPAAASALPPGGVDETPGTPPGSVEITTPVVPQKGKVGFCVHGFRVDLKAGGSVGQQFMIKFDDFGSYGIGPYTPDANGDLCATVSANPADHTGEKGGAVDKIGPELCDPGKEHWLRFLSGSWAYNKNGDEASLRSLHAEFRFSGNCGDPPPSESPGGGPPATTPETTSPGPTKPGTTSPGTTPAAVTPVPRLASPGLRAGARRLTITFRPVAARTTVAIALRTAAKVRLGDHRRLVTLVRPVRRTLAAGTKRRTVTLRLTGGARALLRTHAKLAARLTLTPDHGKAGRVAVTLRRAEG